jgi:hypothetical protein
VLASPFTGNPALIRTALASLLLAATVACSGSAPQTIDREVFIATYVDLRMAALGTDSARIGAPERDEILQRYGVTADELTAFAEVHADDLDFMRDVWNEVEVRMDVEPEDDEREAP